MSWTNEEEKKKYEAIMSSTGVYTKTKINGKVCPLCELGTKSGENKHTESFNCGHSVKKELEGDKE